MTQKYHYTKKTGRPSKIDKISLRQVKKLALAGFTDNQLADFFDITATTLNNWKLKHLKFFESLKDWKRTADEKVEKSLYQRAIGYNYDEVTYEKSKVGGLGVKLEEGEIEQIKHCETYKTKIIVKQVVPDVIAQIFWLKNRQPDKWREKTEIDFGLKENLVEKFAQVAVNDLRKKADEILNRNRARVSIN